MMHERIPLAERARGRWLGILGALGIDRAFLTKKHTACPICCEGKDRFRYDDKDGRGTWICSRCGAGDGVALIERVLGLDFKTTAERIEAVIGDAPRIDGRPERTDEEKRADVQRLWREGKPVVSGDPVALWLDKRVGPVVVPKTIRTLLSARYFDGVTTSRHPAMIAAFQDATGRTANLHRTFLTISGNKAQVDEPRLMMPGDLPAGGAVRLAEAAPFMGIAEGIETAFAASLMFELPVWAALNDSRLEAWMPPEHVTEIMVFGDNDPGFAGQKAAYALARRLTTKGIRARVEIPIMVGRDWNDEWDAKRTREQAA